MSPNLVDIPSKVVNFKNFDFNERRTYITPLSNIFAKRLIKEKKSQFFPNLENEDIKINEGIPENFILPNTGPKFGVSPITWIPDYKFKILIGKKFPFLDNEQRVWFKIIFNELFNVDVKDTMCSVIQNLNRGPSNETKNVILSCLIIPDFKQLRLAFHFYILRDLDDWKRLKTYYYIGIKKSKSGDIEIDNLPESETISFEDFSSQEKGLLGESLGNIFANHLLTEYKSLFFPELENELMQTDWNISRYKTELSSKIFSESRLYCGSWSPDLVFQITSNASNIDLIFESNPKKIGWIEVKTGKNATFERSQKADMERSCLIQGLIVLYCNILPTSLMETLEITFMRVQFNSEWKVVTQYYFSDF